MNPLSFYQSLRGYVDSYAGVLGRRFLALIWIAALAVLIWLYADRIPLGDQRPFGPPENRMIAIGVLLGLWLIWTIWSWFKARRADRALIDDVTDTEADEDAPDKEVAVLRDRLKHAMATMRKALGNRSGFLYELPWYLLIGAPGSGKTTLMTNSGLKFPMGDALNSEPVQGVAGTKNCNWWFTNEAILIDTAGRYTTQETYQERDKAGWLGFLKLLKRHRAQQPINGVIITLSLTDLLTQDPETRLREIRAVRQRLAEIEATLKIRVPFYLVLTKADRMSGFMEFFDALGDQQREQVWGITFDLADSRKSRDLESTFVDEYRKLKDRLNSLLLDRMQQEQDITKRGAILRLTAQVDVLQDALAEIVGELTEGQAYSAPPLLRGLYFASATQESITPARPTARAMIRSYFVKSLIGQVILGESALVTQDKRISRHKMVWRGLGATALAAVFVFLAIGWGGSYLLNSQAIGRTEQALFAYEDRAEKLPVREVKDKDFLRILPALNILSDAPEAFSTDQSNFPIRLIHQAGLGFDQTGRMAPTHKAAYRKALGSLLLTRMLVVLQDQMQDAEASPNALFDALKHYLALTNEGRIDDRAINSHFSDVFQKMYPGRGNESTRAALQRHVAALIDSPSLPTIEIDRDLVANTRAKIAALTPAERAYHMLGQLPATQAVSDWRPSIALGPVGADVFTRSSGKVLRDGIKGLYTRVGYQSVVVPQIMPLAEAAAGEAWVRGTDWAGDASVSQIGRDVMDIYTTRFRAVWRETTEDLIIAKPANLAEAVLLLERLSSSAAPLERLSMSLTTDSDLIGDPDAQTWLSDVEALPFDPLAMPDPFGRLRKELAKRPDEGGEETTLLAQSKALITDLYDELSKHNANDGIAGDNTSLSPEIIETLVNLRTLGRESTDPLGNWLLQIYDLVAAVLFTDMRNKLSVVWETTEVEACSVVAGRYPFDRSSPTDLPLKDFIRLFGPDGVMQRFFKKKLKPLVDTTTTPWQWRATDGETSTALTAFQTAQRITEAFFPDGSVVPKVKLSFEMLAMSPGISTVRIHVGSVVSGHRRDGQTIKEMTWPVEGGRLESRFYALPSNGKDFLRVRGAWSPFRLIDAGNPEVVSANQMDVTFTSRGRTAKMRVTVGSVMNPFTLSALTSFQCPSQL